MNLLPFLCANLFFIGVVQGATVNIAIHHWNDVGAQLETFVPLKDETAVVPVPCDSADNATVCHGGHARLVYAANANISGSVVVPPGNILRMSSGNLVGGESGWLSMVEWDNFGKLLNTTYNLDAMSVGMKEFGAGLKRTNDYLGAGNFKTVLSNVDCKQWTDVTNTSKPEDHFCLQHRESHKIFSVESENRGTVNIGVVGFINENVEKLGSPDRLKFTDIVTSLKEEVNALKNKDVKFIIALGDGSLTTAKNIIDEIPDIKVVIYGMGYGTSKDMAGNYPEQYKNSYIATAGKYGATVGTMVIRFDSNNGNILDTTQSRIVPLEYTAEINIAAEQKVSEFRNITNSKNTDVGQTLVSLHGGQLCWEHECNLGNVMADAALHCVYHDAKNKSGIPFELLPTGNIAAVWHGGALYYDKIPRLAEITKLDIHRWLPYHNTVRLVSLSGSSLRKMFELSASALDQDTKRHPKWGQFLQVSNGLQVTYSTSGGVGKVESIRVAHDDESVPTMDEIKDDLLYLLVLPSYLHEGRSIYGDMKNLFTPIPQTQLGYYHIGFDDDCLENYIIAVGKLATGFEERIFIDTPTSGGNVKCKNNKTKHVLLTLFITLVILAGIFVGWKFLWPRFRDRASYPANQP